MNFITSKVIYINRMFEGCSSLKSLDLSYIDTSQVSWINHMFYNCSSLTSLNVSHFNTSKTSDFEYLFAYCSSLSSLDVSNFDTSLSTRLYGMFSNCVKLTSLNISNFVTSNIKNMSCMFANCSSLTSLDLSNFDTSKVTYMYLMFSGCSSLTSLELSNFNTSSLNNMNRMFSGCSSLTSLNLSSFDTSLVTNFCSMFYGCSNLTSLDLSNFNTSNAIRMHNMFDGCINLQYINLKDFSEENLDKSFAYDIFKNVPDNIVICINTNNSLILSEINKTKCYAIDCSNNWLLFQHKINNETGECMHNCYGKYEYNGEYLDNCTNGYYIDQIYNINRCKCELDTKCLSCSPASLNLNLCIKCNDNFYPMENDPINEGDYINCYDEMEGYYLDHDDSLFKKCYYTCEACEIRGDNKTHNCLKCNSFFNYSIEINNKYFNCYNNTIYNSFSDIKSYILNQSNNISLIETYSIEISTYLTYNLYYNKIIEDIKANIISPSYNTSKIENGQDEVIITEKMNITITTTKNQNDNKYNNFFSIDLGECETLLRNFYNISNNTLIYITLIEVIQEGMKIPKIEYDIYSKLNGKNLEKLNISICEDVKIFLSVPVEITESLDILNTSSGYYNDICYTAKSESGTDIILNDRKNEFIEGNKSVCQDDCDFIEYNYTNKKAICSCDIKESSLSFEDININKTKLYQNFKDIKNIANINILICYKVLFTISGILYNIGSYIIIADLIFHIVCIFLFYLKQNKILKNKINDIILALRNIGIKRKKKKKKRKRINNIIEN